MEHTFGAAARAAFLARFEAATRNTILIIVEDDDDDDETKIGAAGHTHTQQ